MVNELARSAVIRTFRTVNGWSKRLGSWHETQTGLGTARWRTPIMPGVEAQPGG